MGAESPLGAVKRISASKEADQQAAWTSSAGVWLIYCIAAGFPRFGKNPRESLHPEPSTGTLGEVRKFPGTSDTCRNFVPQNPPSS